MAEPLKTRLDNVFRNLPFWFFEIAVIVMG